MSSMINTPDVPYANVNDPEPQIVRQVEGARVFIAGANNTMNAQVLTYLQKIRAQAIVASSDRKSGESIMEQYFRHGNDFNFAVVILNPDANLYQIKQDPHEALMVSDQEFVFELGFLVGKLGRMKVAAFYEPAERFKRPTEYFDVLYTAMDSTGQWQEKLLNQMKAAGITIREVFA